MAQTRRSTARGLEQVPSRRLSAVPAEEAASEAARRGKRRGRIKYRIFTLGLGLDMTMLFLILVLLAVGLVMMFSASYAYAYYYYGNSYYFILRQGMFALVGVVLMLAISTFDYHQLHKLNLPVFAVSILLLLMVLVFKGTKLAPNKGGAVRWLNLGFVEFQPSEIAKFALILMFAHLIALYGERMKTFRYGFLPFFGILGLICVLVIAEKHVSATIIICLIAFIMMFVGGTKFRYFAVIGGAAAAVIGALVLFPQNLPTPWTVSTAGLIRSTRRRASIHGRRCSHFTPSAPGSCSASASGSRDKSISTSRSRKTTSFLP